MLTTRLALLALVSASVACVAANADVPAARTAPATAAAVVAPVAAASPAGGEAPVAPEPPAAAASAEAATQAARDNPRPLPAFPGAEGFGAYSVGGRGGKVFIVTNLEDYGHGEPAIPGSLREAVEAQGPRIVVFAVSGTIQMKRGMPIFNPYITIAGQTAPGDGICLAGGGMGASGTHDVVVRYLRVRPGDKTQGESDAIGVSGGHDIIFDHISATWSIDEVASTQRTRDITVQWCIIAWPLNRSTHPKGDHGLGSLINGIGGISYHHNLYAHCLTRTPRPQEEVLMDFRNNVIYDWGHRAGYNVQDPIRMNYIGNYLKPGPITSRQASRRAFTFGGKPLAYVALNRLEGLPQADGNNWLMMSPSQMDGVPLKQAIGADQPVPAPPQATSDADTAYRQVLEQVGCSLPRRDALDERLVREVREGAGGVIDSQDELGGWPELVSQPAPADTDRDGMPDQWEQRFGLNPADEADSAGDADGDGYTNVEEYCNATDPTAAQPPPPAFDLAKVRQDTHDILRASRQIMKERREGLAEQVSELEEAMAPNTKPVPPEQAAKLPPRVSLDLGDGVMMDFVLIPAGTFMMGSPDHELARDDSEKLHQVTITRPFYMAATETTRAQYGAVGERRSSRSGQAPYDGANWAAAGDYCVKLSGKLGRRLRLPTEAEWEYACRAGTSTPFAFGQTISTDQANFDGTFTYGDGPAGIRREELTPAGSLAANPWGLYDMHGNAWEWCYDTYRDYPDGPVADPAVTGDGRKVIRGGSHTSRPEYLRSASRYSYLTRVGYGFRVVLEVE